MKEKKFILKEATRKRCVIIKVNKEVLSNFIPINLNFFHLLQEEDQNTFSIHILLGDELVEFIKTKEISRSLLKSIWLASQNIKANIKVYIKKKDLLNYEKYIKNTVLNIFEKIKYSEKKIDEKIFSIYLKVIPMYTTLINITQRTIIGSIDQETIHKYQKALDRLINYHNDIQEIKSLLYLINKDQRVYDQQVISLFIARICGGHILKNIEGKWQLRDFLEAALFYKFGTSEIPYAIMHKSGVFTKEDYEIMRTYPERGSKELTKCINSGLNIHRLAPRIALELKERYDGSGYPHKMKGPYDPILDIGIHPFSTIISLSQIFSSVIVKRFHRGKTLQAMSYDQAIKEIQSMEKKFDTQIHKLFVEKLMS